jgi:hypothetical protein
MKLCCSNPNLFIFGKLQPYISFDDKKIKYLNKDMGKSLIDAHLYQQMAGKLIFSCNYVLALFLLLAMLINLVQNLKSHGCCKTHLYACKVLLKWACSTVEGRNVFCLGFWM